MSGARPVAPFRRLVLCPWVWRIRPPCPRVRIPVLAPRQRWVFWRSPSGQPAWARPALLGIAALAALLYAGNIADAGLAPFYSTAAKSMSQSWHGERWHGERWHRERWHRRVRHGAGRRRLRHALRMRPERLTRRTTAESGDAGPDDSPEPAEHFAVARLGDRSQARPAP